MLVSSRGENRGRIPKSQLKVSILFIDHSYFIRPSQHVLKSNWATYVSANGKEYGHLETL